ncbi:hypothetical protein B0T22DRAFT_532184 [Podospora appendiculata]|uniref:Uncharacterized protein n=1 Tax=Podospora appendiculata TaxID=314037 RepID=A0AAE1CFY4_9PEZI|nr:hypothetical protein B0T22DRAFT_532184 [Podospora appendiculata]
MHWVKCPTKLSASSLILEGQSSLGPKPKRLRVQTARHRSRHLYPVVWSESRAIDSEVEHGNPEESGMGVSKGGVLGTLDDGLLKAFHCEIARRGPWDQHPATSQLRRIGHSPARVRKQQNNKSKKKKQEQNNLAYLNFKNKKRTRLCEGWKRENGWRTRTSRGPAASVPEWDPTSGLDPWPAFGKAAAARAARATKGQGSQSPLQTQELIPNWLGLSV